jgi:hypothetical protein
MTDFQDRFVGDLLSYVPDWDPAAMEVLKDTLVSVWGQFREEYEWVTPGKLDRRFCRFLL